MSAQEIATYLGVAERTVRRWITAGELPAEKRGRTFAIRFEDAQQVHRGLSRSRAAHERTKAEETARRLGREHAELRGRYMEARDRIAFLEAELERERRRSARLEVKLELATTGVAA